MQASPTGPVVGRNRWQRPMRHGALAITERIKEILAKYGGQVPVDVGQLTISTIRTRSMDAVQAAQCGHPGTPMALAPVVYCLCEEHLRFDPDDPRRSARGHAAYETLLLDWLLGDAALITRSDEVEAAWSVVDPIIAH